MAPIPNSLSCTEERIIALCIKLSEDENLQVTIKESFKGGMIAGASTVVGGFLGGPLGIAAGSTVGGCLAAYAARGKFLSVAQVIQKMPHEQQRMLVIELQSILKNIDYRDFTFLMSVIAGDTLLKRRLLEKIVQTIEGQANVKVANFQF